MCNRNAIRLAVLLAAMPIGITFGQDACSTATDGFYRFDNQAPWLHGFDRRASPFSGHASFRPSNYKQAIARSSYMQMHAAQFHAAYTRRPSNAESYRMSRAVSRNDATNQVAEPIVRNGIMSPIRSIRIAKPQILPATTTKEPQVIRAIQREDPGPLFPLP
jgi:hypothetical protein